jgi:CheY-like chemotaxis protein
LGGAFDLESAQGRGTKALLSLPLGNRGMSRASDEDSHGARLEKERSPEVTTGKDMPRLDVVQVLLVDDHTMLRQGLRKMLEGYEDVEIVGEAWDGQEAVQAVDQLRPGVVVMDINMPTMNGIDATAQIKARHPETIVIGLSVNADDENQDAMVKAGASLLMSKEATIDQLHQKIHASAHEHSTSIRSSA